MNLQLGKSLQVFYSSVLISCALIISCGLYYYWSIGPANSENVNSVIEANGQIDALKTSEEFGLVKKNIENSEIKDFLLTTFSKSLQFSSICSLILFKSSGVGV